MTRSKSKKEAKQATTNQEAENPYKAMEQQPALASVMLAALRENPLTMDLKEHEREELVERALRDKVAGDEVWLKDMVYRLSLGEELIAKAAKAAPKQPDITVSSPMLVRSQEELDDILEAHRHWMKQVFDPGLDLGPGRANLRGADLRGFSLEGRDLRAALLEDCQLEGSSMHSCQLAGAKLNRAKLQGADLRKAKLRRCDLSQADLRQADLRGADLRKVQAKGALFEGALLEGVLGLEGLPLPKAADTEPKPAQDLAES